MLYRAPLLLLGLAAPLFATAQTVTVAFWDLNGVAGDMPAGTTFAASFGEGLFRFGPNDEGLPPATRWDNETGTAVNLLEPFGAGQSLRVTEGQRSNGAFFQVEVSTLGLQNLQFSFAYKVDTANGHLSNQFSWSTNGTDFTPFGAAFPGATVANFAVQTYDLAEVSQLNDQANVYLRVTLGGAVGTNFTRDSNWDNFRVDATVVPEPSAWVSLLVGCAALAGLARRRRRP